MAGLGAAWLDRCECLAVTLVIGVSWVAGLIARCLASTFAKASFGVSSSGQTLLSDAKLMPILHGTVHIACEVRSNYSFVSRQHYSVARCGLI